MSLENFKFSINHGSYSMLSMFGSKILKSKNRNVILDIDFLRPYCIVYFDQIIYSNYKNRKRIIEFHNSEVNQYIKQSGFKYLNKDSDCKNKFADEIMVKLKRFKGKTADIESDFVSWLEKNVKNYLPENNGKLWKKIVQNIWEVVCNGIIHSESKFGISACGQLYPNAGYFELAFYDSGIGINNKVKGFKKLYERKTDLQCIEWALKKGNTTQKLIKSSGMGLYYLRKFVKLNLGEFQIISGKGFYQETARDSTLIRNSLSGTLVNIRIKFK